MPSTTDGWSRSLNGSHHVFTAHEFEKPDNDDRQYRLIRLPNQLEALLIHDASTDKASAALDVHVGNLSDPVSKALVHSFFFFFWLERHCRYETHTAGGKNGQEVSIGKLCQTMNCSTA
jgi:hypothetical protein